MKSGDVAMIVSFSDTARVEQVFTDNRRELLRQLDGDPARPIAPRRWARRCAWPPAGQSAAGVPSRRQRKPPKACRPRCIIFSDGKFPDVEGFYARQSEARVRADRRSRRPNVGIAAFSTRRREDDKRPAAGLWPAGELRRRERQRPTSSCISTTR